MTQIKETPLPLQQFEVSPVMDGRKTMFYSAKGLEEVNEKPDDWRLLHFFPETGLVSFISNPDDPLAVKNIKCPYGKVGDLLWVRETTYADYKTDDGAVLAKYSADNIPCLYPGLSVDNNGEPDYGGSVMHWWYKRGTCPSVHMPKEAARTWIRIISIRPERLQDISEEDAIAEGVEREKIGDDDYYYRDYRVKVLGFYFDNDPIRSFRTLIDSLSPGSWDRNQWVWVIGFETVSTTGKENIKAATAQ